MRRRSREVPSFVSPVAEIEGLTHLDFGEAVRDGDIRAGMEGGDSPALSFDPRRPQPRAGKTGRRPSPEEERGADLRALQSEWA